MWRCTNCGQEQTDDKETCWVCHSPKHHSQQANVDDIVESQADGAKSRSAFVKRYLDLYRAARLLIALGSTVKTIGIVAAIIIFVFWFIVGILAVSQTQPSSPFGPSPTTQSAAQTVTVFVCIIIGAVFGALVGGLFFLLGVLISAQGQLLMAQADCAVHTSPFLSGEERAAAMSLPYTALLNKSLDASGGSISRN